MRLKILSVVLLSFSAFVGIAQNDGEEYIDENERKVEHFVICHYTLIGRKYRLDPSVESYKHEDIMPLLPSIGMDLGSKFRLTQFGSNTLSLKMSWVGGMFGLWQRKVNVHEHLEYRIGSGVWVVSAISPGITISHNLNKKSSIELYVQAYPNISKRNIDMHSFSTPRMWVMHPEDKYRDVFYWSRTKGINYAIGLSTKVSLFVLGIEYRFGKIHTKTQATYNYPSINISQEGKSPTSHLRFQIGVKF